MESEVALHIIEFLVTGNFLSLSLYLSLYAYPNACRTILWAYSGKQKWSSKSEDHIYFYTNHRERPPISSA
jgi:hypothetical protein